MLGNRSSWKTGQSGTNVANTHRRAWFTALLIATVSAPALAGPPAILGMFQEKSQAATEENLVLRNEHGPWLILAKTLSGDDAEAQAIALAKELKTMLRMEVYVHRKEFDNSQPLAQATAKLSYEDRQAVYTKRYKLANSARIKTYAVLVGNFTSADDPRILDTLQRVKTARPACLMEKDPKASTASNSQNAQSETTTDKTRDPNWLVNVKRAVLWQRNEENAKKGPMGAAFVTRNPLLPDDFFQHAVDDFVVKLNDKVEYSLLKSPGKYTVRVASFNGRTITELATSAKSKFEDEEVTDALEEAAEQATKLTAALRAKGVEAYVFHDRTASYVTIGSFDTLGDVLPTGQFVYNPDMVAVMNQYCGYELLSIKDPQTGFMKSQPSCKTLDKIPFDVEGKFISVPRATAAKLYGGSLLGKSRVNQ